MHLAPECCSKDLVLKRAPQAQRRVAYCANFTYNRIGMILADPFKSAGVEIFFLCFFGCNKPLGGFSVLMPDFKVFLELPPAGRMAKIT